MTVAIVLGAAVRPDGTASPALALRTAHAVALYHASRVQSLILTGGAGRHGPPESHVARDLAVAAGVPPQAIQTETTSTTTVENLLHARMLLPQGTTIIIVSNRWHLPRAWIAARLLGLRATASGPRGTAGAWATARAILREAVALPLTIARAVRSARRSAG